MRHYLFTLFALLALVMPAAAADRRDMPLVTRPTLSDEIPQEKSTMPTQLPPEQELKDAASASDNAETANAARTEQERRLQRQQRAQKRAAEQQRREQLQQQRAAKRQQRAAEQQAAEDAEQEQRQEQRRARLAQRNERLAQEQAERERLAEKRRAARAARQQEAMGTAPDTAEAPAGSVIGKKLPQAAQSFTPAQANDDTETDEKKPE